MSQALPAGIDQISSEEDLRRAFRAKDHKRLELPKGIRFPLNFEHYVAWIAPSGTDRFLVLRDSEQKQLVGMVFKKSHHSHEVGVSRICDWCHAYGSSDQIDLMTVTPTNRRTVGMMLCVNLDCIENLAITSQRSRRSYYELADNLCQKISRFYRETYSSES